MGKVARPLCVASALVACAVALSCGNGHGGESGSLSSSESSSSGDPAASAEDALVACAPTVTCRPLPWFFDNATGNNDPGPFSSPTQICNFEELAAPPTAVTFGRTTTPGDELEGDKLLVARWADGSISCVVITVTGDDNEPSVAYDCELPDSFFEQCAAQAEQGSFSRECVDWHMWPFDRFDETSEVRCGPLE